MRATVWVLCAATFGCEGMIGTNPLHPGDDPSGTGGRGSGVATGGGGEPGPGTGGGVTGTGGGTAQPNPDVPPFACTQDAPGSDTAHRLSRRQLQRTLQAFVDRLVPAAQATPLLQAAWSAAAVPAEAERYKRWGNDFSSQHAQSLFTVADALATALSSGTTYAAAANAALKLSPGTCATLNTASPSVDCQKQLIRNLGRRLLRRPLVETATLDEVELYRQEYASATGATAFSAVVFRLLLAPESLFRIEAHEVAVPGRLDVLALSSAAIANRLSYTYWNSAPDETLLGMAASTDLSTEPAFSAALDYVLAQAPLADSTDEFMGDWLSLDKVPHFQSSNPAAFAAYAGAVKYDDALRDQMIAEVRELGAWVTRSGGTFADLFTTDVSFARSPELMKLYRVTAAAPAAITSANAVRLPAGRHQGVLTRAALLVTAAGNKNPVLRGAHIRRDILCLSTPPPPADLPAGSFDPPPYDASKTVRERYTEKTSVQPCFSCHVTLNTAGNALSNYNGLGQYEDTEPAFKADGTPNGLRLPVDAVVDFSKVFGGNVTTRDSRELTDLVASRPETQKCFTQDLSAFLLGRAVSPVADGCRMNHVYAQLRAGKPLREAMRTLATEPDFRLKKL
ncbi:MAG: DUF1592 domain-containing protein [Archangiaceae bacterium]|nr:DUF1592 domain-containing protein [Archangiaceae bacterium]